jgi:threonine dehydrogenase-like Zn-dependent dehydrogenase
MRRSAHVAQVALNMVKAGVVEVAPLVTDRIPFDDESTVQRAFEGYGDDSGSMKFTLCTTRAVSTRSPEPIVRSR